MPACENNRVHTQANFLQKLYNSFESSMENEERSGAHVNEYVLYSIFINCVHIAKKKSELKFKGLPYIKIEH